MNTDFQTNLGVMRISPRLKLNATSPTLTNLGLAVAFQYFSERMYCIAGTRMFRATAPFTTNAFVEDTSTGAQTDFAAGSDMVVNNDTLVASTTDALYKKVSGTGGGGDWVSVGSLVSGTNHKMAYFKNLDRTYVTNNECFVASSSNTLGAITTTGDYTLSLTSYGAAQYTLSTIKASSQYLWLGTIALANSDQAGRGLFFQWDGLSAQPTDQFVINAHGIAASLVGEDDVPYVMDTNGILQKWTGYGFKEVGRLPVNSTRNLLNAGQAVTGQFINSNGLCTTENGTILANVTGMNEDGTQNENFAGGVYEFDLKGGCSHLYSPSLNPIASSTITDWGQNRVEAAGAIINTSNLNIASAQQSKILIGANYRDASYNGVNGIFVDNYEDTIQKKGYFVTQWFESNEIADSWDSYWISARKFLAADDKIVFKYRVSEEDFTGGIITWTSTTTFTILNSSVDISNYWTSGTGGEVEILAGVGSGLCAHITNAVNNAGTWTVTIDETATGATSQTALGRFQKWVKVFPELTPTTAPVGWGQVTLGTDSAPRVQLKGCFTLTGQGEFYKSILISNEDIKAN